MQNCKTEKKITARKPGKVGEWLVWRASSKTENQDSFALNPKHQVPV